MRRVRCRGDTEGMLTNSKLDALRGATIADASTREANGKEVLRLDLITSDSRYTIEIEPDESGKGLDSAHVS